MLDRIGPGPVFAYESLVNARRWQVYAGRAVFVAALLVGIACVWIGAVWDPNLRAGEVLTFRDMARVGQGFFHALAGLQLAMILLVAPAATAGSICMDRARGTLAHMLVTDLSDAEIVLGKLAARLAPVLGMVAAALPVASLAGLLGGVDFGALAGVFVLSLALAVFGCTLAVLVSVHAKRTHEALMAVYILEGAWLLALPIWWGCTRNSGWAPPPEWFQKANPFALAFAPYTNPGWAVAADYAAFVGGALLISAALAAIAVGRLRSEVVAWSGLSSRASWGRALGRALPLDRLPGPSLDGNPVLWREWHRNRPSRLARVLWGVVLGVAWLLALWGTYDYARRGVPGNGPSPMPFALLFSVVFGLLMLSASAPTALAEERVRGSLDALMATPLPTSVIVAGKWWGAFRGVLILAVVPAYAIALWALGVPSVPIAWPAGAVEQPVPMQAWERAAAVAVGVGHFFVGGAVIVSLGLALATWVPRLGRAVGLSVAAFVLGGIGWPVLVLWLEGLIGYRSWGSATWFYTRSVGYVSISLSPLAGPISPYDLVLIFSTTKHRGVIWLGLGLTALLKLAVAWGLYYATLRTFDRCLGRVPESQALPESPSPAPVVAGVAG